MKLMDWMRRPGWQKTVLLILFLLGLVLCGLHVADASHSLNLTGGGTTLLVAVVLLVSLLNHRLPATPFVASSQDRQDSTSTRLRRQLNETFLHSEVVLLT